LPGAEPAELTLMTEAAREAGAIAMRFFGTAARRWTKDDDSPVTEADIAVDHFLHDHLTAARSGYGWLSEEREDDPARLSRQRVFIVDPIDGTRAFIAGEQGWVVSIGLVEDGRSVAGVLFDPVADELWSAAVGAGAFMNGQPLAAGTRTEIAGARVAASKKAIRIAGLVDREGTMNRIFTKSLARRLALVAQGRFDAAIASASARDWDLAAAVLLVQEAGGTVSDLGGAAVRFNRPDTRQPSLVAAGKPLHAAIIEAARAASEATEGTG
jgi:myo-inositol-1(or 4)-monophosphatase